MSKFKAGDVVRRLQGGTAQYLVCDVRHVPDHIDCTYQVLLTEKHPQPKPGHAWVGGYSEWIYDDEVEYAEPFSQPPSRSRLAGWLTSIFGGHHLTHEEYVRREQLIVHLYKDVDRCKTNCERINLYYKEACDRLTRLREREVELQNRINDNLLVNASNLAFIRDRDAEIAQLKQALADLEQTRNPTQPATRKFNFQ